MATSWTTEHELTFLDELGTYRESRQPGLMRLRLLENYVQAARERTDWGTVNRETVMRFAKEKLTEARQQGG